jgi:HEAT repeat protein
VLRTLGFFNDPRSNQALFESLHSPVGSDRVNAILGLRDLGSKEVIPALIAMLEDPDAQVRQVGHFALEGITREKISLPPNASAAEAAQAAKQWHAWWRDYGANFTPTPQPACRDW